MTILADPIEERDVWRDLWRALTGDALLILLCVVASVGLVAMAALPQQPAAGTSDPVAYSRWEAEAKRREDAFYEPLTDLGLNAVAQATWWRAALAALIPIAGLRLADRLARLIDMRRGRREGGLRDERRIHVMLNALPLADLAARLRARRYRVMQPGDDVLVADRAPWAELLSVVMHLGLILAAAGWLLNLAAGWEAKSRTVVAGALTPLPGGYAVTLADSTDGSARLTAVLQPGDEPIALVDGQEARTAGGLHFALRQALPGYRLSVVGREDKPLLIRASNFVSPTTEVLITLSPDEPERYLAIPGARLALALTAGPSADQPVRLRVFAIPSGKVISDSIVQPEVVINNMAFQFRAARSAVIDARYAPGDALWWIGLLATLAGAIGSLLYPIRRILIRRRGGWTEFYAAGRDVRREVALLTDPRTGANSS
jgi:hypothetical protein